MEEDNEVVTEQPESLLSGDEPITLAEGEYFLSDGVKGSGEKPDWYIDSKYTSVADQAKGYNEIRQKLGSFTGSPKDGYTPPEGVDADDELFKGLQDFATKSNMNQEGMLEAWELLSAQNDASEQLTQEQQMEKLGDNAKQRLDQLDQALKNKLGDKYDDIAPLVNTAESVLLVEAVLNGLAPMKLPIDGGVHPQGLTLSEIEEAAMKKHESGQLMRSVDPAYNDKINKMWEEYAGTGEHKLVIG